MSFEQNRFHYFGYFGRNYYHAESFANIRPDCRCLTPPPLFLVTIPISSYYFLRISEMIYTCGHGVPHRTVLWQVGDFLEQHGSLNTVSVVNKINLVKKNYKLGKPKIQPYTSVPVVNYMWE